MDADTIRKLNWLQKIILLSLSSFILLIPLVFAAAASITLMVAFPVILITEGLKSRKKPRQAPRLPTQQITKRTRKGDSRWKR